MSRWDSPETQILDHVEMEPNSGCWLWMGARDRDGYGIRQAATKMQKAHRRSYEVFVGPIPDGLTIDHLCRVRPCVNPRHLEPVTAAENLMRGNGACARNSRKTECPKGHAYDETNTYTAGDGSRKCLACKAAWSRDHRGR